MTVRCTLLLVRLRTCSSPSAQHRFASSIAASPQVVQVITAEKRHPDVSAVCGLQPWHRNNTVLLTALTYVSSI